MSENPRSLTEIDVRDALDAVEVATFEADELLNRVLIRTRLPTDRRIYAFEAAADPSHWSNIIEPAKYAAAFERVSTALEKVKLAIDSLTSLLHSQPPDQNT